MALRPLCFGVRVKGRTLRVQSNPRDPQRYVVEVERRGKQTRQREHPSLASALRDLAQAWRDRLH